MKIDKTEESGKGINTIINKYGKNVFKVGDNHLVIKMPYNKKNLRGNVDNKLNDEETITKVFKTNNKITVL
ncbi:MAG: hypothetical protein NC310_07395 [Roseburia sp.]|nr:hypothetical protein [Anaeroplasma bactoclasticum]MCM1196874.1 hypothetical protein [Roseburia sp.]MCM1556096.1 hypothetical protein [Anaeroplasma bactoclasticum]